MNHVVLLLILLPFISQQNLGPQPTHAKLLYLLLPLAAQSLSCLYYLFLFSMCFKSSSISFALWVQDKGISNYTFNMFSQCKYFFPAEMSFPQLIIFEMSVVLSKSSLLEILSYYLSPSILHRHELINEYSFFLK